MAALVLTACDSRQAADLDTSVYRVLAARMTPKGSVISRGTAFKVFGTTVVATNHHVVQDATSIAIVYWKNGKLAEVPAKVEFADVGRDLALLITGESLPGAPLVLASYTPQSGSEAWAYGFPGAADSLFGSASTFAEFIAQLSGEPSMSIATRTYGTISSERQRDHVSYIQHQVPINPGNSGGPLVDACGVVIGINTLSMKNAQAIFGAVSTKELSSLMGKRNKQPTLASSRCWTILEPRHVPYTLAGAGGLLLLGGIMFAFRRSLVRQNAFSAVVGKLTGMHNSARPQSKQVIQITPVSIPPSMPAPATAIMPPPSVPAARPPPHAMLQPLGGGTRAPVRIATKPGQLIVGRDQCCDVVLDDPTISRRHARFQFDEAGDATLEDLGSGNGTWINGAQITRANLTAGDKVGFGSLQFQFRNAGAPVRPIADSAPPSPSAAVAPLATWVLSRIDEDGRVVQFVLEGRDSERVWTIGRSGDRADLVLKGPTISGRHAAIRYTPGNHLDLADLDSSNGTLADGLTVGRDWVQIDKARRLTFGDQEMTLTRN